MIAFVFGCAGTGVDHHAGGFVDDGEVFVFEENAEGDVFGEGVEGGGTGGRSGRWDGEGVDPAGEFQIGVGEPTGAVGRQAERHLVFLIEKSPTSAA